MAQSRTAVNAKAAPAEAGDSISPSLVPGQSKNDLGGPTPENERSTDNSTKLDPYKGAPGSVSSSPEGKIGDEVIPGNGKHDGTKGRSNEGPDTSIGPDVVPGEQAKPSSKTQFAKAYEHAEVDETAGEALEELATDHDASDDFKARAKVIFESALNQKLQLEVQRLEEEFSQRFESEITDIAEKVEGFLNYTSQQWLEENKLVVENGIRNELSESFMQGLRGLFEDHYVTLPDEKYDIFESMVAKLDDMEDKLNEQIEANVNLSAQMSGYTRQAVLADVSWDLSEAGKDRLAGLSESVEFESEDSFRQKLEILKESFAGGQEAPAESAEYLEESAEVLQPTMEEGMTRSMAAYTRALSRTIK
jgi:hypothetical protein